jgi:DNA-binding NarL/FixJ family response regulator
MGWFRVLVVEDFAPFRQLIRKMLANRPHLQVIGVVSDGFEAVQRALELKPDLILLDIGLPSLGGIEATRQIRKLSPGSKIVFLSQESSPDVVQEAVSLDTCGYVLKAKAGSDLFAAVDAVLDGVRFVSGGLLDC